MKTPTPTLFRMAFAVGLMLSLQGCLISTAIGAATDVAIGVVKVPFKVAGAVVDAVSDSDEEAAAKKQKEAEKKAAAAAKSSQ